MNYALMLELHKYFTMTFAYIHIESYSKGQSIEKKSWTLLLSTNNSQNLYYPLPSKCTTLER